MEREDIINLPRSGTSMGPHPPLHPLKHLMDAIFDNNDTKIFDFIVSRFTACFANDAVYIQKQIVIDIGEETFYGASASYY